MINLIQFQNWLWVWQERQYWDVDMPRAVHHAVGSLLGIPTEVYFNTSSEGKK